MYKSQLQEYAQKAAIPPPVYEFVKEGASHEPRFKAIVILNNVSYESPPGYPNLKSAEHAAAKVALDGLQASGGAGVVPSPVHESGLCKNLLQEYAQKNSLPLPVYQSQRSGEDHAPTFTSSVEIAGVKYSGGFAKNKKEAEIKAARTALLAIQSTQSFVPVHQPHVATTPAAPVGLATLISTHLNNTPGKKRGRGAADAIPDEPGAGRLKTGAHNAQGHVEVPSKGVVQAGSPGQIEDIVSLVTESVPEVQDSSIDTSVAPSVVTPDMFVTPGAKRILQYRSYIYPLTSQITTTLEHSLDVQPMKTLQSPQAVQRPEMQQNSQPLQDTEMQQSSQPLQAPVMQQNSQPLQAPVMQQSSQPLQAPEMQQRSQFLQASHVQESPQPLQAPQAQQSPQPLQIPEIEQSSENLQAAQTLQNSQTLPTVPDILQAETSDVFLGIEPSDIPSPQFLKKESTFIVTNSATGTREEIVVTQEVLAVDVAPNLQTTAQNAAELDHGATEVHG